MMITVENIYLFSRRVYHTDWGSEAAVVRTDLDGSNDITIVNQLENPNGVHYRNGKCECWHLDVISGAKCLASCLSQLPVILLATRKHSSMTRIDRDITRMSTERVVMRPIVDRMTDACENITFPCGR